MFSSSGCGLLPGVMVNPSALTVIADMTATTANIASEMAIFRKLVIGDIARLLFRLKMKLQPVWAAVFASKLWARLGFV
jgi:hypothetical protein